MYNALKEFCSRHCEKGHSNVEINIKTSASIRGKSFYLKEQEIIK